MDRRIKEKREKRKNRPWKKTLLIILLLLLVVVGAGGAIMMRTLNKIERVNKEEEIRIDPKDEDFIRDTDEEEDTMNPEEIGWGGVKVVSSPYVKNILLIGQDRRPGEGRARSDSMIICSLNTKTGVISLASLMRDMYVPIPEYSSNRINAAYAFGGMSLLDEVIKEDFGIVIDGNVEVDFDGFVQVMSLIAPLDIELKSYEADYLNQHHGWSLTAGVNSMSAEQLLQYSRIRMVGNADYERTERQRRVVGTAINKLKNMDITKIYSLADAAMPCLTTDMSNSQILGYASTMLTKHPVIGGNYRLPLDEACTHETIYGMWVLVPDLEANSKALQEYLYGDLMKEDQN